MNGPTGTVAKEDPFELSTAVRDREVDIVRPTEAMSIIATQSRSSLLHKVLSHGGWWLVEAIETPAKWERGDDPPRTKLDPGRWNPPLLFSTPLLPHHEMLNLRTSNRCNLLNQYFNVLLAEEEDYLR